MQPSGSVAWLFCALSSVIGIGGSIKIPYEGAQNYWPLTERTSAMTVPDLISGANGNVHKAAFIKNIGISGAASFSGGLEWIDFPTGRFKLACIENPESCQIGITIAFWIRFKAGKYILATGAFTNSSQGTGIRITHANGQYCATVRTQTDVWQVSTRAYNTSWCHVVVRWSSLQGLQMFLNGKSVASDKKGKSERTQPSSFSKTLTIARPPRLTQKGFGKFDLAHLAVWLDHLTDAQISQLGDLVLDSNDNNQYQCVSKNVSCTNNPCSESCLIRHRDAVCLNIRHQYCPEILKDKTTVASNTAQWRTQSATSIKHLTKDVNFTPTALSTKRPSRNTDASGQDSGFPTKNPIETLGL